MSSRLSGLNGSNPLHFLAALGLLRIATKASPTARLSFVPDGTFTPSVVGIDRALPELIAEDAAEDIQNRPWWLTYAKEEKKGTKTVADLKAPPVLFRDYLDTCLRAWGEGDSDAAAFASAFGTSEGRDGKNNTKPTAFHFAAANMQFLDIVDKIRASVRQDWAARTLFEGGAAIPGSNLRWDPAADRNRALMAKDPNDDGTQVDAPLEWLAFRALPLFATFPEPRNRVTTVCVTGRGDDMCFSWPLWSPPASLATVRALLSLGWANPPPDRTLRGIFATCTSSIRRTAQGFGNFSPASVST